MISFQCKTCYNLQNSVQDGLDILIILNNIVKSFILMSKQFWIIQELKVDLNCKI